METIKDRCQCHISYYPKPDHIIYCPLHKAALSLLEACKYALSVFESIPEEYAEQIADILDESIDTAKLEQVITEATRPKTWK